MYGTYASLYPFPGRIQTYYNQLAYLSSKLLMNMKNIRSTSINIEGMII